MYVQIKKDMSLREIMDDYLYGYAYDLAEYFWTKGLSEWLLRYIANYYSECTPTIDDIIFCLENSDIDDIRTFMFEGRIRR